MLSKVVAPEKIGCLSKVTNVEKAMLCTCPIVCGRGYSHPLAQFFPRKNFNKLIIIGTPPGTLNLCHRAGGCIQNYFLKR